MNLEHLAAATVGPLLGRVMRRAAIAIAVAITAIVALYQFTVAALSALEAHYGAPASHLVIGGAYAIVAIALCAVLWATRLRAAGPAPDAVSVPREMQMAMLVEAVMLGYALARKRERSD